jgi:putative transcriptional regulator
MRKPEYEIVKSCSNQNRFLASCLLLVLSTTSAHVTQDKPNKGDSEDKTLFLVAHPNLREPIFKESVVLMFPSSVGVGEGLVVGLILNKPARVALNDIFPNDKELKNRTETAYFGGPVDPRAPGVLFRSSEPAKEAVLLFGDVYVSFDPDFIKELLKEPRKTPDLRLFVGRSQWAPAQLQNEMVVGAWYSVRAETNLIFSASSQYLWRKLLERAEPAPVAKASDVPFGLSASLTDFTAHVSNTPIRTALSVTGTIFNEFGPDVEKKIFGKKLKSQPSSSASPPSPK